MRLLRKFSQSLFRPCVRPFAISSRIGRETNDALIEVVKDKAIITLNRPKALNALNLPMIRVIYPKLIKWQNSNKVKLIIIKGEGDKSFCAGGDVRSITESEKESSFARDFFREEYHLNHAISISKVPWIALLDGVTMGGGVGLSVHGEYRIATERSLFSMPETAIGLIPDVGGGFFLPRLNNHLGFFLALSGHRLKGKDLLHAGIATHFMHSEQLEEVEDDLLALECTSAADIEAVLQEHQKQCDVDVDKAFSLEGQLQTISEVFSSLKLEDILAGLEKHEGKDKEWCSKQLKTILKMSPTSLKVTLKQLQKGAQMATLKEVLEMEYEIVQKILKESDFFEGVRAVLVDRDNSPKWTPNCHTQVTDSMVDEHFNHLPTQDKLNIQHDL